MKAMILAAGRGERMRPLTDYSPKPLLKVGGIPLIEHHIIKLALAGFKDIIINHAWLGHKIEEYLGNGERWGVTITYSREGDNALETAGGIIKALPVLCESDDTFLVVNGDIYTDYSFVKKVQLLPNTLAHLLLVPNPEHNVSGDFELHDSLISVIPEPLGIVSALSVDEKSSHTTYTFSGIAVYHKTFFASFNTDFLIQPLGPLLKKFAGLSLLSGEVLNDKWVDVGTPERLKKLNEEINTRKENL